MQLNVTSKRGLAIIGVAVILTMVAFFSLKYKYEHTVEKYCIYVPREVSDLGPPEKVCPRVCERHKMEYDSAFSYSERKLGTECNCCGRDAFQGNENSQSPVIP